MDIPIHGSTHEQLHEAWRRGDTRAAAQLVACFRPRLRSLGAMLGLSEADADDLAQQVLLEAPGSRFEERPDADYFSWLSAIARRKVARMFVAETAELPIRRPTTPRSAAWRSGVVESIEQMPERHREVFLRLLAGYNPREIADELDLEATAVRMRIHRGRQWLRRRGH